MKIDRRKTYITVLDTETANTLEKLMEAQFDDQGNEIKPARTVLDMSNVLAYDIGWAIVDKTGKVYRTRSFVNRDIFCYENDLMQSAYYAKKLKQYRFDLKTGKRKLANLMEIRKILWADMAEFGSHIVCAHNCRFDYNGLNGTLRYVTKSKFRYFFPFGTEFWDTMKMAQDVICKMPTYKAFCESQGQKTPRKTAEMLFRFITGNPVFKESHTGLEDVLIEKEILAYCFRQHKAMRKRLFERSLEFPPRTEFQKNFHKSLRENPVIPLDRLPALC